MIKFTIVTCTFNAEHELQRTLDSVFHQSYADVEHLILDGLSSDRSVEMAQTYKQRSDEATVGFSRPRSSRGARSGTACWCAIRPFMR